MLQKIIFLLFSVVLLLPSKTMGQDYRNVIWIHGYGGDITTWDYMAWHYTFSNPNYPGSHKMIYLSPKTYETKTGVDAFVNQVVDSHNGDFRYNQMPHCHAAQAVGNRNLIVCKIPVV